MKFTDLVVLNKERLSIGIEGQSGKYYLSIPVANNLIDYDEYYEIDKNEFDEFNKCIPKAVDFAKQCRSRKLDDRLILKPGSDRGVAI